MAEVLPLGVGRVPQWWMECTPHYILDLEEDEARRRLEDQMAVYYQQMAAADDAGLIGPDGQPKLGPDGKPLWSSTGWGGRGPGGEFRIDPKVFGISESDPDYQSYLTGAKLPPGFLEKMQEMCGPNSQNMANNLKQTDYGRYGRQAEKPAFTPSWMKKKLRSTGIGDNIRNGVYNDSPNKHYRRRLQEESSLPSSPYNQEFSPPSSPAPRSEPEPEQAAPVQPESPAAEEHDKKMVRKVRKVRRVKKKKKTPEVEVEAPTATYTPEPEPEPTPRMNYTHSDYYYNAKQQNTHVETEPQQEDFNASYDHANFARNQDSYSFGGSSAEMEIPAGEYDDEAVESDNGEEANLTDLQAILAAKQAELARLKAQM